MDSARRRIRHSSHDVQRQSSSHGYAFLLSAMVKPSVVSCIIMIHGKKECGGVERSAHSSDRLTMHQALLYDAESRTATLHAEVRQAYRTITSGAPAAHKRRRLADAPGRSS